MMIFLKREFRESNLVSEKIDPLKVLLSSLFFLCLSSNWGGEFFLQVLEKRGICIFFTKNCKKKDRKRREKSRRETFDEKRRERRESSLN